MSQTIDPVATLMQSLNHTMRGFGMDGSLVVTVQVPVALDMGGYVHEDHLEAQLTENGMIVPNQEEQLSQITARAILTRARYKPAN